ncbi:DUF3426 domain-containing protein, partial [Paracidovorax cattleyae]|uniref:DUF3426 domain-containing protein n=1 Tax=Paracidovorax cattleyae TaxID=80868 RepID=UPI00336A499B
AGGAAAAGRPAGAGPAGCAASRAAAAAAGAVRSAAVPHRSAPAHRRRGHRQLLLQQGARGRLPARAHHRSRADYPVAMPALELTLTDAQEQPVLRRVLLPQDLSAPAELPAHGEWGGAWPVNVGAAGNARVAGYRLLAFYP